jgi:hypothetical protein
MRKRESVYLAFAICASLGLAVPDASAQNGKPRGPNELPMVGAPAPPPPVPPATVSRGAEGGVSVRAVRLAEPIRIDGRLDEDVYRAIPAISDFIQQDPREGERATEQTEVWLLFDDRNIYVSARMWDSHPEREIATEMRRDGSSILSNETFSVMFDTFHDKRNGFVFYLSPLAGLMDIQITDEGNSNRDWNTVWDAKTGKFENGWTVEMVIPFKSLRYRPGPNQVWGVNFRRVVRWKNEWSYLTRIPSFLSASALFRISLGATLVGLEVPSGGLNLELKPYAISGLRTDRSAKPAFSNKRSGDFGFDAKYGVTKSLTADFTYNTDFAQVEDDQQQVNLTRFALSFPEKRDFFLEGQGTYSFGSGAGRTIETGTSSASDTPVLFFSRRIGLNNGKPVPIRAGGRVTGKAGRYTLGLLNIQSDDDAISSSVATNFSVARVKRDLWRRSYVGGIYTRRSVTTNGAGVGETFGIDSLYSASPSLNVTTFFARTRTPELSGRDTSYRTLFDYNADRYGAQFDHQYVGTNFNPEVGFLRRKDFRRSYAMARFSPRPDRTHMRAVRKFTYQASFDYYENGTGRVDTREEQANFGISFQNSDSYSSQFTRTFEFIPQPFAISLSPAVTVPVGGYTYQSVYNSYTLGTQRTLSGTMSFERGSLYGGTKTTLGYSSLRVDASTHLAIEGSVSLNWVDLPVGRFTSSVVTERTIFTVTPRMFVTALVQYNSNSRSLSTNVRMRWEYQPGSEMFVVFSDGRDTSNTGFPTMTNRTFVVKINRLFRF